MKLHERLPACRADSSALALLDRDQGLSLINLPHSSSKEQHVYVLLFKHVFLPFWSQLIFRSPATQVLECLCHLTACATACVYLLIMPRHLLIRWETLRSSTRGIHPHPAGRRKKSTGDPPTGKSWFQMRKPDQIGVQEQSAARNSRRDFFPSDHN